MKSTTQFNILKIFFENITTTPNSKQIDELVEKTDLTYKQVKTFFANHRRRQKEKLADSSIKKTKKHKVKKSKSNDEDSSDDSGSDDEYVENVPKKESPKKCEVNNDATPQKKRIRRDVKLFLYFVKKANEK